MLSLPRSACNLHVPECSASSSAAPALTPLRQRHSVSKGRTLRLRQYGLGSYQQCSAASASSAVITQTALDKSGTVQTSEALPSANVLQLLHPAGQIAAVTHEEGVGGSSLGSGGQVTLSDVQGGTVQAALRELLSPKADAQVDSQPNGVHATAETVAWNPAGVTAVLRRCRQWRSVQAVLGKHAGVVNARNLATAMRRVAQLHGPQGTALSRPERLAMQSYMGVLARACLVVGAGQFNPADVAAVLYSLST